MRTYVTSAYINNSYIRRLRSVHTKLIRCEDSKFVKFWWEKTIAAAGRIVIVICYTNNQLTTLPRRIAFMYWCFLNIDGAVSFIWVNWNEILASCVFSHPFVWINTSIECSCLVEMCFGCSSKYTKKGYYLFPSVNTCHS